MEGFLGFTTFAIIPEGCVGGSFSNVLQPTSSAPMPITYPRIMQPFRLPPPKSTHKDLRYKHKVRIFHPYYPPAEAHDPMLQFMATDGGAQYLMVYYACCIVANNCMKEDEGRVLTNKEGPFLSTSPSAEDRITVPVNDILEPGNYYFIVPSASDAPEAPSSSSPSFLSRGLHYPIIPTFDDWQPPENIPQPWQDVEVPVDIDAESLAFSLEDQPCYVSNHKNGIELAHIIPAQEASGRQDRAAIPDHYRPRVEEGLVRFSFPAVSI
ncbi:hypothetical protein F4774DRAFT_426007 [Daldinia eschscholtzii]|nr:hypothetical protein F4774DRAFT_426007 [Daldinia eschscholtzii]